MRLDFQKRFKVTELFQFIGILYLLRVPLLLFAVAAVMTWGGLSASGPGALILEGIYDVAWPPQAVEPHPYFLEIAPRFLLLTLSALVFAATLATCSRNILRCAERFQLQIPDEDTDAYRGVRLLYTLPPLALALTIVIGITLESHASAFPAWTGNLLGLAAFAAFMRTGYHFRRPSLGNLALYSFAVVCAFSIMLGWLKFLSALVLLFLIWLLQKGILALNRNPVRWLAGPRIGYTELADGKERLKGQHLANAHAFSLSLAIYAGLFFIKSFGGAANTPYPVIPTLSVLLLLGVLVCWTFCGISFFLDYYRIPLIVPIVAYGSFTSVFPQSDHFFRIFPEPSHVSVSAKELLSSESNDAPVVLVSLTGGGIRATAWAARVLRNLQLASGDEALFRRSIRLVSSVSGGSFGAMYFLHSYTNGDGFVKRAGGALAEDDPVLARGQASSLDDIAVELAYQDTILGLTPFLRGLDFGNWPPRFIDGRFIYEDRGLALETAIKRGPKIGLAKLSMWKDDAQKHLRPAVIFNASSVESGKRFLFGTTDLEPGKAGRIQFSVKYPNMDIDVATAARLSATFPIVSPAARPVKDSVFELSDHLVDGGYTDDYGMASLVEWLDGGLTSFAQQDAHRPKKVMILEIRSSSEAPEKAHRNQLGFVFQTLHPILTLANARETGQLSHNDLERDLLKGKWRQQNVEVCHLVFQTPRDNRVEPLNWHLTADDIASLRDAWGKISQTDIQTVADYLHGKDVTCN